MASSPEDDDDEPKDNLKKQAVVAVSVILLFTGLAACALGLAPSLATSGLLAYSFGLRHAVDADHIAAIDNVTRRLTTGGKRPVTVGLFFAMGHSLVVTIMCFLVVVFSDFMKAHMASFTHAGAVIGASISGTFLVLIGLVNMYSAKELWDAWREGTKYGGHSHPMVGMCAKLCPGLFDGIKYPWQMLPVGFLFGLGFDTSSEVALLGIVAISRSHVPKGYIMILPLLFMAGMCLIDTLNGILMAWAYGRALQDTLQRLYYNLFLTTTSGVIALLVGGVELLGAIANSEDLHGGIWDIVGSVNDNFDLLGGCVVGLFLFSMLMALCCFNRVFPGGRPKEDPAKEHLLRYLQTDTFIDRSGV